MGTIAELQPDSLHVRLTSLGFSRIRAVEIEGRFLSRIGRVVPDDNRQVGDVLTEETLQQLLFKSIKAVMRKMSDAELEDLEELDEVLQ